MNKATIVVYHSLEATGSGKNPSVRSQNLNASSFSNTQHKHNLADYQDMNQRAVRRHGYPDAETHLSRKESAQFPRKPMAPLAKGKWDEHAGRVVDHLGSLRGTADRHDRTSDDIDLEKRETMFRSASRTKFGRDADLTVLGEVVLDDPSYTSYLSGNRADPNFYQASSVPSQNGKTSNAFSVVDGFAPSGLVNFGSKATIVAKGQSYVVVKINELCIAFVHTPNKLANEPNAGGFYSAIIKDCIPDIFVGDTNRRGMIGPILGGSYENVSPSRMTTVARPEGFVGGKTNSTRTQPFDQIAYNTNTTEMLSAHFIPSDVSGATISDHFGLIFCAKKITGNLKRNFQTMNGGQDA